MKLAELDSFKLADAVQFHNELNPVLFEDERLKPQVRDRLLLIAKDFLEFIGVNDFSVKDITISGSNAAYSYTKHSDVDLHVLVDMSEIKNDEVYTELFKEKKNSYNEYHDIYIYGYEVELYVQDAAEPVISLGEYSVLNDKWIHIPKKRRSNVDETAAKLKFEKLLDVANNAIKSRDEDKIIELLRVIKKYRQAGLDKHGEFGPENLAFKVLRSRGIIDQLYRLKNDLHDDRLSLPEDSKLLNKPTPTIQELAKKHKVSPMFLAKQLDAGIKIEQEHTSSKEVAREIALDHLNEDPKYYIKLKKVETNESKSFYCVVPRNSELNLSETPCFSSLSGLRKAMFSWLGDRLEEGTEVFVIEFSSNESLMEDYEVRNLNSIKPTKLRKITDLVDLKLNCEYEQLVEGTSGYSEVEFICANPEFPDATDPIIQQKLFNELKKIEGVIPLYQDQSEYSEGQMSLTAIFKGHKTKNKILKLAKLLNVEVDLIQPVSDDYVDRAIRGEHEGQMNYSKEIKEAASGYIPSDKEKKDPRYCMALTVDVKPDSIQKNAAKLGSKIKRNGVPPLLR